MAGEKSDSDLVNELNESVKRLKKELSKRVIGQHEVIDDLLACFFAGGHCLLVGVPGLAKTILVRSIAQCMDLEFGRVQFTPDLMPADITGSEILFTDNASGNREFRFVKGPVFCNIMLADEINRTPPKTQAALLQSMQEYEVTSSGKTFSLPSPFWVLATQNPIEQEGTYPLPEAQQDRFMFSVEITYPDMESEVEIVRSTTVRQDTKLEKVLSGEEINNYRGLIWRVPAAESIVKNAVSLVRATRPGNSESHEIVEKNLTWGAGPRAAQYLIIAAKAYAVLDGRTTPDNEDLKKAAYPVLRHRLVRSFHAEAEGVGVNDIVDELIKDKLG